MNNPPTTDRALALARVYLNSTTPAIKAYAETLWSYAVFKAREFLLADVPQPVAIAINALEEHARRYKR